MDKYRLFLNLDVHEQIKNIKGPAKNNIIQILYSVRDNPFFEGQFQKFVEGRKIAIAVIGRSAVYFWSDHASREVKVIELLLSD